MNKIRRSDYRLIGRDTALAIEEGLAEATRHASPVPRPPKLAALLLSFRGLTTAITFFRNLLLNSTGRIGPEERAFIPESYTGMIREAFRETYLAKHPDPAGIDC